MPLKYAMISVMPEPAAPGPIKTVIRAATPPKKAEKAIKVTMAAPNDLFSIINWAVDHFQRTRLSTRMSIMKAAMPLSTPTIA